MSKTTDESETPLTQFETRKADHIRLALKPENQANQANQASQNAASLFERIELIHEAIPDINFDDVTLETTSLGRQIKTPFFVSSMTAGHSGSIDINATLAKACAQTGWAMGVGSQRRQLMDDNESASHEWKAIRKQYPELEFFGNIGLAQAITSSSDQIQNLADTLNASAMIIHCNPLQEVIQPEGTPHFGNAYDTIQRLQHDLKLPLIIKETGCGFSKKTLGRLSNIGVDVVDLSGLGGTHWGRIEGGRAHNALHKNAAVTFKNWGIDTVSSLLNAQTVKANYEIWGSGGIRTGLDAAKLLAMGATRMGIAKPMLEAALKSTDSVVELMHQFEYELKIAFFCTGSKNLTQLQKNHLELNQWRSIHAKH